MIEQRFPKGWDLQKVTEVIDYYDNQTEEEAVEEMEQGFRRRGSEEWHQMDANSYYVSR